MIRQNENSAKAEDKSPFTDKKCEPSAVELHSVLGSTSKLWNELHSYTLSAFPKAVGTWSYPGEKYGWSFRISDKKRVLIYLLPRNGFFKAGFVFGEKAYNRIMESKISKHIKDELSSVKVYGEGRGIRIEVRNAKLIEDLKLLIDFKISS